MLEVEGEMVMLTEVKFTNARKAFTELFDDVWHRSLPAIVNRKQAEEVLLLRRDLQQYILQTYAFRPEVLPEDDGSITIAIDGLDIVVNAPTRSEAIEELVQELKIYAEDYRDNLNLFLNAPNRKAHFPYVLRIWLCENDQEIKSLLEF